ncbi:MAG: hypothetical protein Q8L27_00775 [archaeon]|nr:hypothetical protein [archaeon]
MKSEQKKGKISKKAIEMDYLGYTIIGVAVLAIVIFSMIVLKDKGVSAIDYIKNLFRFGK